jgi:hypothetical protein
MKTFKVESLLTHLSVQHARGKLLYTKILLSAGNVKTTKGIEVADGDYFVVTTFKEGDLVETLDEFNSRTGICPEFL